MQSRQAHLPLLDHPFLHGFCLGGSSDDELDTSLKTIDWKLPKVRFFYRALPPPPPPDTFGAFHDLVAADL